MKILLTGGEGQVGMALRQACASRPDILLLSINRQQLDITNQAACSALFSQHKPNLIINCAAFTAVDDAEKEKEQAFAVNSDAVGYIAEYCAQSDTPCIHLSTDFVFDGLSHQPYDERANTAPLNTYGASKLAGEKRLASLTAQHIILRVSAVFSPWRHNFVKTILRLALTRPQLHVVTDQFTCPTPAEDIATAIMLIIDAIAQGRCLWGCYHFCGHPVVSWHEFAKKILDQATQYHHIKNVGTLLPILTKDFSQIAKRPSYSALNCKRIQHQFSLAAVDWHSGLHRTIKNLDTYLSRLSFPVK